MSKDIRNLIDLYEEKNRERSQADSIISSLKEEIERLKFTVKEQKILISEYENKKVAAEGISNDVNILKDLVLTQRQEIQVRDDEINKLEDMVQELVRKYEKVVDVASEDNTGEELIKSKKLVVYLTNENEHLKETIEDLEDQIEQLKTKVTDEKVIKQLEIATNDNKFLKEIIKKLDQDLDQLRAKAIDGNVTKELELANEEIERLSQENMSLSDKITLQLKELRKAEPSKDLSKDIEEYKQKIEVLTVENDDLNANISYLQNQLDSLKNRTEPDYSSELKQANGTIETLKLEIADLQAHIDYLQQELEKEIDLGLTDLHAIPLPSGTKEDVIIVEDELESELIIQQLTAENESYRQGINHLNQEIAELKQRLHNAPDLEELELADEKIEALLLDNDDLQEQNKYLVAEIEKLKELPANPQQSIDSEEEDERIVELEEELQRVRRNLNNTNQTMDRLIDEIDGYKREISELEEDISSKNSKISAFQEKIDALNRKIEQLHQLETQTEIPSKKTLDDSTLEEIGDLKERAENAERTAKELQEENLHLNQSLLQLKQGKAPPPILEYNPHISQNISIPYQKIVYIRLISQLPENRREKAIESLIHDLRSQNYNIKRFAISILSEINDDKVYEALVKLAKDRDWMIRFLVVKALSKFDNYNIRELLEVLSNDADLDVREAAVKLLRRLNAHV